MIAKLDLSLASIGYYCSQNLKNCSFPQYLTKKVQFFDFYSEICRTFYSNITKNNLAVMPEGL